MAARLRSLAIGLAAIVLASCAGNGPAPSAASTAAAGSWVLAWSDEFDGPAGSAPNPAHWESELGNAEANGWGNRELQYYTRAPRNAALDGSGHLVIRAEKTPNAGPCWNGKPCEFTSARLLTRGKVSFSEGKLEARIRVPAGAGLWPAFWTLGEGPKPWPEVGEIDVLEYIGKTPDTVYATAHGPGYSGAQSLGKAHALPGPVAAGFHVYTLIKRPNELVWLVNGVEIHRLTPASLPAGAPWVFEKPFFLLLNLAVGGDWPGPPDASTPFPATMTVDWVRIYRQN